MEVKTDWFKDTSKVKLVAYGVLAVAYATLWYQMYKKQTKG